MSEWQPIETAPRDGTLVLVRNAVMGKPVVAKFGTFRSEFTNKCYPDNWIVVRDPEPFPCLPSGRLVIPTHWQPLPPHAAPVAVPRQPFDWLTGAEPPK